MTRVEILCNSPFHEGMLARTFEAPQSDCPYVAGEPKEKWEGGWKAADSASATGRFTDLLHIIRHESRPLHIRVHNGVKLHEVHPAPAPASDPPQVQQTTLPPLFSDEGITKITAGPLANLAIKTLRDMKVALSPREILRILGATFTEMALEDTIHG